MLVRGRVAAVGLTLVAAVLVAVALVGVLRGSSGGGQARPAGADEAPIAATGSIAPRIALFGDTVRARVEVALDRGLVDPGLVRVRPVFGTWERVGQTSLEREDSGQTTYLRYTYTLRCLIPLCIPTNGTSRYEFKPAKVSYVAERSGSGREMVESTWPVLIVHSRLDTSDLSERDPLAAPWRADLASLPAVTYRIRPGLLTGLLLAIGAVLVAAAAVLLYRMLPRRVPPAPPPPPPKPVLSPLEQALVLLEAEGADDGVADRRRALELVADELSGWDEPGLERSARTLAWSEEDPAEEATRALAATVRAHLEERVNGHPG